MKHHLYPGFNRRALLPKGWLFLFMWVSLLACQHHSAPHAKKVKPEPPGQPLENTNWKLESLSGINEVPKSKRDLFLQLKNGMVNGYSGCNNFFGSYEINSDSVHFSNIASTKMVCANAMTDVESNLFWTLSQVNWYHTTGKELRLFKDHTLLAVYQTNAAP